MANKSLADLRIASLQLSNYEASGFITTPELNARVNEAVSALYDLILGSRETYFQRTLAFTLAGGFGGNTVALPADQYKIQGLDYKPGTTDQIVVPTLPSFRERFSIGHRCYDWIPGTLTIYPPTSSQGNYLLYYTPYAPVLADLVVVTTAYPTVAIDTAGGAADGTLKNWFFPTGAFDATYIGRFLHIAGAANAGNNGFKIITSVPDATDLRTASSTVVSESFGVGVTAAVYTGPLDSVSPGANPTWVFNGIDFTADGAPQAGDTFTVAGSATADGTYTVLSVLGPHSVQTVTGGGLSETFLPGVTVTYQPHATVLTLPDRMQSGALWIELHTAASILDKAEMDSSQLKASLAAQTQRIQEVLRWRQDEPKQVPLVRRRGPWGWRGGYGGNW